MTPRDIGPFCALIRSEILELTLDCNHVGNSIWALFSLKIQHLKVLCLANADICGFAVRGFGMFTAPSRKSGRTEFIFQ